MLIAKEAAEMSGDRQCPPDRHRHLRDKGFIYLRLRLATDWGGDEEGGEAQ